MTISPAPIVEISRKRNVINSLFIKGYSLKLGFYSLDKLFFYHLLILIISINLSKLSLSNWSLWSDCWALGEDTSYHLNSLRANCTFHREPNVFILEKLLWKWWKSASAFPRQTVFFFSLFATTRRSVRSRCVNSHSTTTLLEGNSHLLRVTFSLRARRIFGIYCLFYSLSRLN